MYWFVIVFVLVFGGVAMAVQTLVAQAYGAGEREAAARITWNGLWVVLMSPAVPASRRWRAARCSRRSGWHRRCTRWRSSSGFPRVGGAIAGVALWTISSFFNGIGRTRVTLVMMLCVAVSNAVLNQLFIFGFGMGVAGVAWATTTAQVLGFALGLAVFLSRAVRAECSLAPLLAARRAERC